MVKGWDGATLRDEGNCGGGGGDKMKMCIHEEIPCVGFVLRGQCKQK